jgi:YD repeat-containing protein
VVNGAALVEKVLPDGRSWKYAWDFAGQIVEVMRRDGQRVSFAYDALGRRVRKSFAGKVTRYVVFEGALLLLPSVEAIAGGTMCAD